MTITDTSRTATTVSPGRAIGALVALSMGTFSYVTIEMLPIGLLTLIADDLGRSLSSVGLLVTGYAAVVVLASLPLTRLTRAVPRRVLLAVTLGVFVVATVVTATARTYGVLLASRLVTAGTQALFWSIVAATATGLFRREVRGRTVAVLFAGSSLGPVLGVPAGTWLGQQAGWRAAFLAMAAVSLATCVAVVALLPTQAPGQGGAARGSAPDAGRYAVLVVTTALGITGSLTAFTYITAFLLDVSGFAPAVLGPLLLVSGVAGIAGAVAAGAGADRHPRAVLIAPLALITGALSGLYAIGTAKVPTVVFVAVIGLSMSAFAAGIQSRALQVAPGRTDIASAGSSSAYNVGIAAGSLVGGALVASVGVRGTALAGGLLTLVALAVLLSEPLLAGRRSGRVGRSG